MAEKEAILMLENAREEGRAIIAGSHAEALKVVEGREQDAGRDLDQMRRKLEKDANSDAEEIREEGMKRKEAIKDAVTGKVPKVVDYFTRRITGENGAAAGRDETNSDRGA